MNNNGNLPAVVDRHNLYAPLPAPATYMHVPAADQDSVQPTVPLSHYLWIIRRHRWMIASFVGACIVATLIVSMRVTPMYEATATIDIDRQSPPDVVGQEANRPARFDADQFLATQVKLLQSDSVLRPVVQKYNLLQRQGRADQTSPARLAAREKAPIKLANLKVIRPPNTLLLLISYRSADPELAAQTANAIVQSYIRHTFNLRFDAAANLASFMEKQIEELKAKMEGSTAALAQFEKELNVINPEEKTSILSSRLSQLNAEYTAAQGERVSKEAAANSQNGNSMESALASPQGESLRKLLESYNEAQQKFAAVKGQYGAKHPEYRKAADQLAETARLLESTRQSIAKRVNVEFTQARNRELMMKNAVAETKAEFDKLNARSFEYQQLKRDAEADKKLYEELVRRIKEASINANFQSSSIRLADPARPPLAPVFPNVPFNLLIAFVLSSFLAIGTAVLIDILDNTVRDPDEVARTLNTTVIGTLPAVRNWRRRIAPALQGERSVQQKGLEDQGVSSFTESVRSLRNAMLLADFDRRLKTILVTSASPAEGKSTTAAHLALANAQQGKRTLLIDGDLRRPSLHRKFGVSPTAGLVNVLLGEVDWQQVVIKPETIPNLEIVPAGPPSRRASELMANGIAAFLDKVYGEYDLIIVDAPPLLGFSEPLVMGNCADGVLIVVRAGETNRKAIGSVVSTLQRLHVNVLGLVLNEVKRDQSASYYYYGSYNKKYYEAKQGA